MSTSSEVTLCASYCQSTHTTPGGEFVLANNFWSWQCPRETFCVWSNGAGGPRENSQHANGKSRQHTRGGGVQISYRTGSNLIPTYWGNHISVRSWSSELAVSNFFFTEEERCILEQSVMLQLYSFVAWKYELFSLWSDGKYTVLSYMKLGGDQKYIPHLYLVKS